VNPFKAKCVEVPSRPSICFVALNAYNVLAGAGDVNHTGGAEVQQFQIASWLVDQGYLVSFVTLDHGQPDGVIIRGIKIYKAYIKGCGIRGLRFFYPRWTGLWAAMARAKADVYYQRGAESETGQVALWCHVHGRKFIFAAASDPDCNPSLSIMGSWRERQLYFTGLRLANAVTAQTTSQLKAMRDNLGIESILVPNCRLYPTGAPSLEQHWQSNPKMFRVLWVGRISKEKRFEWLLDVAEQCPGIQFEVVGAPKDRSIYGLPLMQRAARYSNVKMHGRVPYKGIVKYYHRCHILCCTSRYEGFPNTFLEAWSIGLPVVSTFDPDGVIEANGLGWVAHDVEAIVAYLREAVQSPKIRFRASLAAERYYSTNHKPEACLPTLERLILRLTRNTACVESVESAEPKSPPQETSP